MCLSRMREAALAMIGEARARGLPVIVAGHDAADEPETYLRSGAAYVIVGEGEVTLGEVISQLVGERDRAGANGHDATAIPGLALLDRGFLRRTPARKLLHDLDALPLAGLGSGRRRALPLVLEAAPRVLLDERRDHARLSVSMQLVREARVRKHVP